MRNWTGIVSAQPKMVPNSGSSCSAPILHICVLLSWIATTMQRRRKKKFGENYVGPTNVMIETMKKTENAEQRCERGWMRFLPLYWNENNIAKHGFNNIWPNNIVNYMVRKDDCAVYARRILSLCTHSGLNKLYFDWRVNGFFCCFSSDSFCFSSASWLWINENSIEIWGRKMHTRRERKTWRERRSTRANFV